MNPKIDPNSTSRSRLEIILDLLVNSGFNSIAELADSLSVSQMTIRRDLEKLESQGAIRRTHGGAIPSGMHQLEVDYRSRQKRGIVEKRQIAQLAASLIKEGQCIFLDAGTTVQAMTQYLKSFRALRIVTTSIPVILDLYTCPNVDIITVGGKMLAHTMSTVGPLAQETIENMHFDWAFLGTGGIDLARGLTHSTMEEIPIKKTAAKAASQCAVLAHHSKFEHVGITFFMPFSQIHYVITDKVKEKEKTKIQKTSKNTKVLYLA